MYFFKFLLNFRSEAGICVSSYKICKQKIINNKRHNFPKYKKNQSTLKPPFKCIEMMQWKIDDTLFYPLGLFNISSGDKTIFVAWSYDCLVTQIFKKVDDGNILTDQFNIPIQGTIKLITLTEYNTFALLESGEILYFSSFKKIKELNFSKNIQYLAPCHDGYIVIRIKEDITDESNLILLEHYQDFGSPELLEEFKRFDITYEDLNLFDCNWKQDNFVVKAFQINSNNRKFFELVSNDVIKSNMIYIFSVNGSVFGINNNCSDNDYTISTILTVSSDVTNIEYIEKRNILLIFLSCGTVEILFESKLFQLLDRTKYYSGCEIIASTFSDSFYFYSDGERIVKVEFNYDLESNKLDIVEEDQLLPGIVAFTWVKAIGKLVCLSENNIFYRAKFSLRSKRSTTLTTTDDLNEITPEKFKKFEANKQLIVTLLNEPEHLNKLIQDEINKQTIIAIYNQKEKYSNLINCSIEFYPYLPSNLKGNIIYPMEKIEYDINSFFGLIEINIEANEIFISNTWNLLIYFDIDDTNYRLKNIKLSEYFTSDPIIIILHLKKSKLLLPKIRVELNTIVECDHDSNYISIPINIQKENITKLFKPNTINTIEFRINKSFQENIKEILKENFLFSDNLNEKEFCFIKKTPIILTCSDICEWFNVAITNNEIDFQEISTFIVYFFGIKISIEYNDKENHLKITTENPIVLYYCKILIAEKLASDYFEDLKINVAEEIRLLLSIQSEIQNGDKKNLNQLIKMHSTLQNKSNL